MKKVHLLLSTLFIVPNIAISQLTENPIQSQMKIGVCLNYYADGFANAFKPDYQNHPENPFADEFLEDLRPFTTIRFHQWGRHEFNTEQNWSERQQPNVTIPVGNAQTYNEFQIPYEYQIQLCNVLQKDYWVNVPTMANTAYIDSLAMLVFTNLDPNLNVYVEYSNEVFNPDYGDNGQFGHENPLGSGQYTFATTQGNALGFGFTQAEINANPSWTQDYIEWSARTDFVVYASARAWNAFSNAFGNSVSQRVIKVFPGQMPDSENPNWTGQYPNPSDFWTGQIERHLAGLSNQTLNPWNEVPDAYCIAPYFGLSIDGNDLQVWEKLERDINERVIGSQVTKNTLDNFNALNSTNIKLVAYEGGQHMLFDNNPVITNQDFQMGDLYTKLLNRIAPFYDLVNLYSLTSDYSLNNCFGLKEFTGQSVNLAPKYQAVENWVDYQVSVAFENGNVTQTVSGNGNFSFNEGTGSNSSEETGLDIVFSGVTNSADIQCQSFAESPSGTNGIIGNVQPLRWVITNSGLNFSNAEIRVNLNSLPTTLSDPNSAIIYHRSIPGSGNFSMLTTSVDGDELVANTSSFSEFAIGGGDSPLSVELESFTARQIENTIQLFWSTASEINNEGFNVYRKTKESDLIKIASYKSNQELIGALNSSTLNVYSFVDDSALLHDEFYTYYISDIETSGRETMHKNLVQSVKFLIEENSPKNKLQYNLEQNFPNPFNPKTTINFQVAERQKITLTIYNVKGELIRNLVEEEMDKGLHSVSWNGLDNSGNIVSSGSYFYRLSAGNFTKTHKMILLK